MSQEQWNAFDSYINDTLLSPDPRWTPALKASTDAGLPMISVAPIKGSLLTCCRWLEAHAAFWKSAHSAVQHDLAGAGFACRRADSSHWKFEAKHAEVARANFVRPVWQTWWNGVSAPR